MLTGNKELRELTRRMSVNEAEMRRTEMLCKWAKFCITANIDADSKYIGAGLITMTAPDKLDGTLEIGNGYAAVRSGDYTFRVNAQ